MGKLKVGVGFHTSTNCFCDGIGSYLANLSNGENIIAAKSVDSTSSLMDFQRLIIGGAEGYGVYRCLRDTDVPPYGAPVNVVAQNHLDKVNEYWPPELDKELFYIEVMNEVDKNHSNWLGELLYETATLFMANGYKFCGPGWSSGEPEPEHWRTPGMLKFLRLCSEYKSRLAISIHEYAFNDNMADTIPFLMGRVSDMNAACYENGINLPDVFITEFGWSYQTAPPWHTGVPQIFDMLDWYIANTPNVKAVFLWALDKGSHWGDIAQIINPYMTPLVNNINAREWEQPDIPEIPEIPQGDNVLKNPSFELGWIDYSSRIQIPNGWDVIPTEIGNKTSGINSATGEPSIITGTVEAIHKNKGNLPPSEWPEGSNPLISDGVQSYKLQAVYMVSGTELRQTITGLVPFKFYNFKIKGKVHYHPDKSSIGEPDDIHVIVKCGESSACYFVANFPDRAVDWTSMSINGLTDEDGTITVGVLFETMWANSRDLFLDEASLESVKEIPEGKPKIVILKLAQSHEESSWGIAASYAYLNYKRTITASHDDMMTMLKAGNAHSYAIIVDPERPSQQESIGMIVDAGFKYSIIYIEDTAKPPHLDLLAYRPCDTERITQVFAANSDYYQQFGLPGHEGVDFGVGLGFPYYAAQGGRVIWASDKNADGGQSNYGWHVYLRHDVNDIQFCTVYAHASDELTVNVGDIVNAGDILGYSGNSGVSTGPHLHFGLLWPTDTGNGYPIWRFGQCVDPLPYLDGKDSPPSKPVETQYDLAPYLYGDGRLYEVSNPYGGSERFQTQGNYAEFLQTKNVNAEQLFIDSTFIYRGWDTSPGNNRFYQQQNPKGATRAPWLPRLMKVGDIYQVSLWVQFFNWDCSVSELNSGQVIDTRQFIAHHDTWTSRMGITLHDVIQMKWVNGGETYFYAKNFGLVAWERTHQDPYTPAWSAISEIHELGQRPDNIVVLPACLQ